MEGEQLQQHRIQSSQRQIDGKCSWQAPVDSHIPHLFKDPPRPPEGGHSNQLQYSCMENPMERGAWWATVHGVSKESAMT